MMTKGSIRVLIVDDHQMVIDGIRLMLDRASDIICAGEAHDGREVLEFLAANEVDLLLLDINMPQMDGMDVCKRVKSKYPDIKVLALTMLKESSLIQRMLKQGADGYILKDEGHDVIINAIRRVSAGKSYYSDKVTQTVMNSMSVNKTGSSDYLPKISRREKQVLKLIVKERTNAEIAEALFISQNTVETHRKNLLHKLNARNTAGLVRIAIEKELLD